MPSTMLSSGDGQSGSSAAAAAATVTGASPDCVFDRLSEMFGDAVDADIILAVGNRMAWNLEQCIERMIEMSTGPPTTPPPVEPGASAQSLFTFASWEPPTVPTSHSHPYQNGGAIAKVPHTPKEHRQHKQHHHHSEQNQPSASLLLPPPQPAFDELLQLCRTGQRVLVCMRGPPGSGKSTLAVQLVSAAVPGSPLGQHICGADDYFWQRGPDNIVRYVYNVHELTTAHAHCKRSVGERLAAGWSPLCVDNTHMQSWEMHDYVTLAVRHGYIVRLLEPSVPWAQSVAQLAQRNQHGVPRDKIAKMLERYQPVTVVQLMRDCRAEYTVPMPQMRLLPPLAVAEQHQSHTDPCAIASEWPVDQTTKYRSTVINSAHMQRAADAARQSFIDLLRIDGRPNGNDRTTVPEATAAIDEASAAGGVSAATGAAFGDAAEPPLAKHRSGCRNENAAFALIPTIYPSKAPAALWDLFERCGGDADWTMDILLTDSSAAADDDSSGGGQLDCDCDRPPRLQTIGSPASVTAANQPDTPNKRMSRRARRELHANGQSAALVRQLEGSVRINDDHMSPHVRGIRELRHGSTTADGLPLQMPAQASVTAIAYQIETDSTDTNSGGPVGFSSSSGSGSGSGSNDDEDDIIELNLSADVISQLETTRSLDPLAGAEDGIDASTTTVKLPKRIVQELYAVWIEDMYNDQDEQRQRAILEDEEFALQLQTQLQKEADEGASMSAVRELTTVESRAVPQTPVRRANRKQIAEMECAWAELQRARQPNQWQSPNAGADSNGTGTGSSSSGGGTIGLAAELAKQKLCEMFPKYEPDVVADVYQMTGSNYEQTVELMRNMRSDEEQQVEDMHKRALMERAKMAAERLTDTFTAPALFNGDAQPKGEVQTQRETMRHYEDCRNLAKHHTQMRAECYAKANQAFQSGHTEVAVFYSRVAHLHDRKLEHCQQHAAISIVNVHNLRIKDPTILDLHYLFVKEAMECLDVFVDGHVGQLRSRRQPHKMVMVITGRGLHSVRGYSTVKIATKARLRDRGLNYTEVNPGLLRIRLHPNTALSHEMRSA